MYKKTLEIALSFIKMCGIPKLSSFSQDLKMELLLRFPRRKESIYSPIITLREMLGTIDFMPLMIQKDWFNFLEVKIVLFLNWVNFSKDHFIGILNGSRIHIIGQEISIIYCLYGSLILLTETIWHKNILEKSYKTHMVSTELGYLAMTIMEPCLPG